MMPAPRLPLHDWSCLRTELVWIYDHAPADKSRHIIADHRRGNWAWFLRKGEVRILSAKREHVARAGQWLLPPAEVHGQDFSDDAEIISVHFLCQWPSGENIFLSPEAVVLDDRAHPALLKSARRLATLVEKHFSGPHQLYARQSADYPLFLRFQRAFTDWLEAWFEARLSTGAQPARHSEDPRVLRVRRVLDETPLGRGFPANAARLSSGVGAVQLNRLFRQELNLTPLQYWERRRLEFARLCLETSDVPLKELSAGLGFRSTSHFTVWFKRHGGTSPGRHREQNLGV